MRPKDFVKRLEDIIDTPGCLLIRAGATRKDLESLIRTRLGYQTVSSGSLDSWLSGRALPTKSRRKNILDSIQRELARVVHWREEYFRRNGVWSTSRFSAIP